MKWLRYENIWVRNGVLFALINGLSYIDHSFSPDSGDFPLYKGALGIFILYALLFVHNIFLLKQFLLKQRYIAYTLLLLVYLIGHAYVNRLISLYATPEETIPFASEIIGAVFSVLAGSGVYFIHLWILTNMINTKKRILHTETELAQLKQQMNPHFLLNALNNLYGVSLATPEKVPDKILELSDLLTYQVETSKREWISLEEEIDFAGKYLHYMEWKTNGMKVNIRMDGDPPNFRLTPLIFLPLLENAVKYASETPEPTIAVDWTFYAQELRVTVTNNFKPRQSRVNSTKTGIENLKRRLELYHPHHRLTLSENQDQFIAQLEIWSMSIVA